METVKERLKAFIKSRRMTDRAFQYRIGASSSFVNSVKKSIGPEYLAAIEREFPELNRDWLLYGEGSMLRGDEAQAPAASPDSFRIPLINIDSVGGVYSENAIHPSEQYVKGLIPFINARDGDVAILESGNSMYPQIPSGALLHLRKVEGWREYIGYGNVFVILLADGRRITKQVMRSEIDHRTHILLHSFNPEFQDEEIPRDFVAEVWKVINIQRLPDF